MSPDCPLVGPEASGGGKLGERNGTNEENPSVHGLSRFGACKPARLL